MMMTAAILPLALYGALVAGPQTDATANRCTALEAAPAAAGAPIFYRYAETSSDRGAHGLTLRAMVDDQLLLTEQVATLDDAEAEPVVELLSRDPDRLAHLRQLAASKGNSVKLELIHPDGTTRNLSFDEVAEASRGLIQSGVLPRRVTSVVRLASQAASAVARIPCDDCYTNYDDCFWACEGDPICERRCERILNRCLQSCSGGGECPTSQTVETSEVVGTSQQNACLKGPFDSFAQRRVIIKSTNKNTRKRITYNCDGSQTVEILDVWYTTTACAYTLFPVQSCAPGAPWAGCIQ